MQRQRRSLRSLRLRGLKVIRQQEFEQMKNQESNNLENANLLLKCASYFKSRPNKILEAQMQQRLTANKKPKTHTKNVNFTRRISLELATYYNNIIYLIICNLIIQFITGSSR